MNATNKNLIKATGPIPFGFTNDCMFHFVFQKDMVALKGLLSAVLHVEAEDIKEIEVCNPLELGRGFESKNYSLDLKIKFNNDTIVNLEMQIVNRGNWPERSLSYLCRSFDNLNKGEDYRNVRSAIHIGFIDFTLFPEEPEFCATYMMQNVKTHRIYTSKFTLKVVELNHTELASKEDRQYKIDKWARLFKATTWEELRRCAGDDAAMQSAVNMMYEYNEEESVRDMCRAREESLAFEAFIKAEKERLQAEMEELEGMKKEIEIEKAELSGKNEELAGKNEELAGKNEELESKNEQLEAEIERLKAEVECLRQNNSN